MEARFGEVTGRGLREQCRAAGSEPGSRRRTAAVALVLGGLALLVTTPVMAASGRVYRLQGTNLATEFVAQPYWLAAGKVDGRHVRLEAGLLGFTDGTGVTSGGYCIDARTHRRHDAVYAEGNPLDAVVVANPRQVRWLLVHGYPNGPALLGSDRHGLARSSSVVQAAIWHYSDGFQLDPAGAPYVDGAYRGAYDLLVREASVGTPAGQAALHVSVTAPASRSARSAVISVLVTADDGTPAPDGSEVVFSTTEGRLSPAAGDGPSATPGQDLRVRSRAGRARALLTVGARFAGVVRVTAAAMLDTLPGRVLVAGVPTQRLVDTGRSREAVQGAATMQFRAPSPPARPPVIVPSAPVRPAPSPARVTPTPLPSLTTVAQQAVPPTRAAPVQPAPQPTLAPTLPASGDTSVSMPLTGRGSRPPATLALGFLLLGAGVFLLVNTRRIRRL
jgi:TQXA domain-containing protein